MPIIQSAKKRVRTAKRATIRNAKTKRTIRDTVKEFRATLTSRKDSAAALSEAQSAIDTAVKKNILHKNKAARKKRQLVNEAKAAGVKATGSKKAATKKTTTAKKTTVKKTATKKTTKKAAPVAKKKSTAKKAPKKTASKK